MGDGNSIPHRTVEFRVRCLLDLNEVHVGALGGNVHIRWTAVGKGHVAGEDDVFSVPADGRARRGPEAFVELDVPAGQALSQAGSEPTVPVVPAPTKTEERRQPKTQRSEPRFLSALRFVRNEL